MFMTAKEIAEYMVKAGTIECVCENYTFYISDLVERLKVEFIDVINMIDVILYELDSMEEVAECSFENEGYFYITFYVDYCSKKNILDECMKDVLLNLKNAWDDCIKVMSEMNTLIDVNDYICGKDSEGKEIYPFDRSFNDIDVDRWVEGVVSKIEKN